MVNTDPWLSKHLMVEEIANGVWAVIAKDGGAAIANSGIIDLGGQVVVFDSFLTPQAAMDLRLFAKDRFGQTPQIVVNSHYHNDHIWGNQVFKPEAVIVSSAKTRQLMTTAGMEEYHWYSENAAQRLMEIQDQYQNASDEDQRHQLSMWIGYYEGLVEALPSLSVWLPEITFKSQLEIIGTQGSIELVAYEGAHTESDTILYIPQRNIVFMSDLLFIGCHPYLGDGDPVKLLKTLKELSQIGATVFVPGHGPVGTTDDLNTMIAYVDYCLDTAQEIVNEGGDLEEKLSELKIDKEYERWQLPQFFEVNVRFLCKYLG